MTLDIVVIQPLVALIAGILILLIPRLLNYVIAIYLILIGVIGLWPRLLYHVPLERRRETLMTEPALRSATALAAAIRAREIGCRELLEHYVARERTA